MKKARAGQLLNSFAAMPNDSEKPSTTHISIIDKQGNAVSMTTSIEYAFGSSLKSEGFLLNNQLTDFSFKAKIDGSYVANRVQPGKRPRSSMSPMIILNENDKPLMIIGSPGGARIIPYVAQTIINILDWNMDLQEAMNQPHYVNMNSPYTELEKNRNLSNLPSKLEDMGHKIKLKDLNSGIHAVLLKDNKIHGAADPRREGEAYGE